MENKESRESFVDIKFDELSKSLEKSFNKTQVETIISIIKKLRRWKYEKVSNTLKGKVKCGFKVGRPSFEKPKTFRLMCIYQTLGYIDTEIVLRLLGCKKGTFYKYKILEKIEDEEIFDIRFKKPNDDQLNIYNQLAIQYVNEWFKLNPLKCSKQFISTDKSDMLFSIFVKLPNYNPSETFKSFCFKCCYDVFNELLTQHQLDGFNRTKSFDEYNDSYKHGDRI